MLKALKLRKNKAAAPPKKVAAATTEIPSKRAVPRKRTAENDTANDSDTVSDDEHEEKRPRVYKKELKKARKETQGTKKLRDAQLLGKPVALYSEVLDNKASPSSVSAEDFEFGADKTFVAPDAAATAKSAGAHAAAGEELAAVALQAKREMGVNSGKAERVLAKEAIHNFEQKSQRRATHIDAKDVRREMQAQKEEQDKLEKKRKWHENCDDAKIEQVQGGEVAQAMQSVRARIESSTPAEAKIRESVLQRLKNDKKVSEGSASDAQETVETTHVRTSQSCEAETAQATMPAPGTEQREAIEAQIKKLESEKIVVSPEARAAKLATGVPPAVIVQGRTLREPKRAQQSVEPARAEPMGALIHGDGSTVRTPNEYAMQVLVSKSANHENLVTVAIENVFGWLIESMSIFYDSRKVFADDADFSKHDGKYAKLFEADLRGWIDQYFPADGKRNATLREFIQTLFAGEKPSDRLEKLREKLKEPREPEEEQALIEAVLVGTKPVAKGERDTQDGVKNTALQWQVDAQIEALKKHVPDMSEEEIAAQIASTVKPEDHVLLGRIRNYTSGDVMFRDAQEAPISLQHENEVIYGEHENSVWYEAVRQNDALVGKPNFMNLLRTQQTRELKLKRARMDELLEAPMLTPDEEKEMVALRDVLKRAEESRRAIENRALIAHYGHEDAAPAVEALFARTAKELATVSRQYAADFLREPLPEYGERPCASDKFCICHTLANTLRYSNDCDRTSGGFVAREFLLPEVDASFRENGKLPSMRQRCYACHLHNTSIMFDILKSQKNHSGERLFCIQPFKTIFEKSGEYSAAVCNLTSVHNHRCYGIFAPFPRFLSNFYQYTMCRITDRNTGKVYDLRALEEMPAAVFRSASDTTAI